jgi:DNA-binding transcriptional ArsR family regulator
MQQKLFKVRDKRNKGWFFLDNEYLNGIGKHLGPTGIAVYVSLCRHADQEQKCFPSQKTIAEEIGSTDRSVRRHLKKLEELNIIQLEKVRTSEGKWLNNIYWLLDKTEWDYPEETISYGKPEDKKDKPIGQKRHNQRTSFPTNNTNTNNTNKKNTNIAKQSFAGLNPLIELFKDINPSYKRLFANKTQRSALQRLVEEHGEDKIRWVLKVIPQTNGIKYAPTITTPLQLEEKLAGLISFIKREKTNQRIVKL